MAGSTRKISTIIEVGGEQNFKKSIKAMGQELAVLSTEMQKVTTSFSANDTEADKLRKTQEALGKQIEARKEQIAAYNKAIESSNKRYQEAEKALTELNNAEEKNQKAINKAQSEYNKALNEIQKLQIGANKAEVSLNQLEQEFSQNEKALKKWSMNISDIGGTSDKSVKQIEKLGKKQETLGKQIEAGKDKLAAYNTAIENNRKKREEAREEITKLNNAEEKNSKEIAKATEKYIEAENELQKLAVWTNKAEKELNQLEREFSENEKTIKKWKDGIGGSGGIAGFVGNFGKEIDSLKREVKEFADQTEEARREITLLATAAGKIGGTVLSAGFNTGKAALEAYGKAATVAATAVAAIGTASVSVGKEFESSMSTVAATIGITAEEINKGSEDYEKLKQAALDAGETTKYTASEAALALNALSLKGYDVKRSVEALPNVLNLAAAGNLELEQAANLATGSIAALELGTDSLEEVVDKMARTAQESGTNVAELGEATIEVAGTAKLFNMSITDMNAELGVLANREITGSEGGKKLRNIILALSAPTKEAQKQLEKLKVSVAENGEFRNLNDILIDLKKSLSALTEEERAQTIRDIFNLQDIKAVNALLNGSGAEFEELAGKIEKANGTAKQMAETMMDNLSGSLLMLKSQLETTGIKISEMIDEPLKNLANEARETANEFTAALKEDGFAGALDYVTEFIPTLGKSITEGIAAVTPDAVKGFNSILTAGVDSLIENTPEAVSGIGYPLIEGFRDAVDNVVEDSKDTLPAAIESIGGLLIDSVPIIIDSGFDLLLGLGDGFAQALPKLLDKSGEAVKKIGDTVQDHKGEMIEVGSDLLYGLLEGAEEALPDILIGVGEIAEGIVEGFYFSIGNAFYRSASDGKASFLEKAVLAAVSPPLLAAQEIIEGSLRGQQTENILQEQRNEMYGEMEAYIVELLKQGKTAKEAIQQAQHDLFGEDTEKMKFFQFEMYDTINEEIVEGWRKSLAESGQILGSMKVAAEDAAEGISESEKKIKKSTISTEEAIKNGGGRMAAYYQQMGEAALESQEAFKETAEGFIDLSEETTQEAEEAEKEKQETAKEIRKSALDDFKAIQKEEKDAFTQTMKDETSALKEEQKEQTSAVKKSHEEQTKALKEAQKEQQDALEKSHKKRLDQIDEEYLEQLKLVDEEAYNRIKAAQAEIDSIDAQTEKEERERELAEEAEKRRRLQQKVWDAKTAEDRREAQEELNEFEEEIRRKRIKEEREQQKKDLNQEISDIQKIADEEAKRSELQQKVWDSEGDEREKALKELNEYEAKINKERIEDGRAERYADLILSYENTRKEAEKERDIKKSIEDELYNVRKTNLDLIQTQELSHLAGLQEAELKSLEIVQKQRLKDLEEYQKKREKAFDEAQETEYSSLNKNIGSQLGIKEDTAEQEKKAQSESILNAYLQGRESATANISTISEEPKEKESVDSFVTASTDFTTATADFGNVISVFRQSVKEFEQVSSTSQSDFKKSDQTSAGGISAEEKVSEEIKETAEILKQILGKIGKESPTNIEVTIPGGGTLARAVINSVNDYKRTTGKDPWA